VTNRIPDSPVRDLLAAVLEALTLPHDAPDHDRRLLERAALARTVTHAALTEEPDRLAWHTGYLRHRLAQEQARADERQAVRASVDAQFPLIARFLADERSAGGEGR
jgi:hypothetical protein